MTNAHVQGVVVDTMVINWLFDDRPNPLADCYHDLIGPRPVLLAVHTVIELRFGALRAGWGELRSRRLERRIAELAVVQPDDEMITECARRRLRCQQVGHALGDKLHDGDRWIAATAIRLGMLVSHDKLSTEHLVSSYSPPSAISSATTQASCRDAFCRVRTTDKPSIWHVGGGCRCRGDRQSATGILSQSRSAG
jgi:predicted nucleic acid-binding protein